MDVISRSLNAKLKIYCRGGGHIIRIVSVNFVKAMGEIVNAFPSTQKFGVVVKVPQEFNSRDLRSKV